MQIYAECQRKGYILRGMIHKPENISGKAPIVIMFHGFTGNRMEGGIFTGISKELEQSGIASARFDFVGSGESDGNFEDMCLQSEIADGETILDFVKELDFVDPNRIGLIGYSLGGLIASLLAPKRQADIKAMCLCSPGFSLYDDIVDNKSLTDISLENIEKDGYVDIRGNKVGREFTEDIKNLHISETISAYKNDVLITHGKDDVIVPYHYSIKYAKKYEKVQLHLIENASHGYETIGQRAELREEIKKFFEKKLK
ncbi:alpha/beta hydrolase family protein [Clostridium neuense]|uniref:Alpha/beta hydrolase family protein n=1 Tax=Clostridium neuense TaxID=1728934 RepID=A0ABW8TLK5_9CLOT